MTLRWGLLGTARINRRLIPAIRATGRSVVAAVGSRDAARGASYAREWDIPRSHGSYQALLDSPVDIIYNALPNSLHVPWTIRAVTAGKHVLCEKPLGLSAADIDDVAAAAAPTGAVVTEGFMYRHHAQTAAILDTIRAGSIGEPRAIVSGFSYRQHRDGDVRLDPSLGGGALWDIGCYPVSFAQLIAGPALRAAGWGQLGPTGIDEHFTGTIEHAAGVTTQVFASFNSAYHAYLRVIGTSGVLEVEHPFHPEPVEQLRIRRDRGSEQVTVTGNAVFVDEVRDIEDAVLGLRPPRLSLEESRLHAATLAALHDSARTGRAVAIP